MSGLLLGDGEQAAMRVGILALQGAVAEHAQALERCHVEVTVVKRVEQLEGLCGLVLPGGESTTVGKLMVRYGFAAAISDAARRGMGIFGTCTGLILMAKHVEGSEHPWLDLMDIDVKRNAYGRQIDSFEQDIDIPLLGSVPFRAIFIRAPYISSVAAPCVALATEGSRIVLAQQGRMLAAAFHPELTDDLRIHKHFLSMIAQQTCI